MTVTQTNDYVSFMPTGTAPTKAFVFYPGGRVDYRAYAAPLHKLAEQGYLAIPARAAQPGLLRRQRRGPGHPRLSEIQDWAVGGHSLGGVAASMYAAKQDDIDGVVYWASYPADDALKNSDMAFSSIYGTLDMGGMESFQSSASILPADTQFVVIEGGNHSQFGNYGLQPGDNPATITWQDQQAQAVAATASCSNSLSK